MEIAIADLGVDVDLDESHVWVTTSIRHSSPPTPFFLTRINKSDFSLKKFEGNIEPYGVAVDETRVWVHLTDIGSQVSSFVGKPKNGRCFPPFEFKWSRKK